MVIPHSPETVLGINQTGGVVVGISETTTYEMTLLPQGATAVRDKGKVVAVWRKQPDGTWLVSRVCWNSDLAPVT